MKGSWKIKLQKFFLTKSTLDVREKFRNVQKLIINGCQGSGKSAVAYHIAFFFEKNEGYDIIPLSSPEDIVRFIDKTRKQIFLFDDAFGKYSIEQSKLNKWENCSEYLPTVESTDNLKFILTCGSQLCNKKEIKKLKIMQTNVHAHFAHEGLSRKERREICKKYLSKNDISLLTDDVLAMYPFLPWICSTYENTNSDIVNFFKTPRSIFTTEIESHKSHASFFSLALLVLSNNALEKKCFNDDDNKIQYILKSLFEESEFCHQPSKQSVISGFKNLKTMFIEETESCYYCIHDQVFDIIVHSIGSTFIKTIINHAHPEIVSTRIMFERFGENCNENTLLIEQNMETMYFNRLLIDMKLGTNWAVFGNVQCQFSEYRNDFLCFLGKQHTHNIFNRSDSQSAFYVSSYLGYYDFCKFIADNDLSQLLDCTYVPNNAFNAICDKGHYKIVTLVILKVLQKKLKDKDITSMILFSTGLIHSVYYRSIVQNYSWYHALSITLSKGPEEYITNQLFSQNKTPFFIAIERNNKDIITLFLHFRFGLNQDIGKFGTPLHYACTLGREEIANMLISKYADVNIKRAIDGFTPLHCSCRHGHDNVVTDLLKHKANINMLSNRTTPLIEACLHSHTQIVKMLLKNGASVNKICRYNTTPLHAPDMIGNIEIVASLLTKNANVNLNINGCKPLHIACSKGHIAVVEQLLQHCSQDILLNDKTMVISPLMIASLFGHSALVRFLLDKGVDVNFTDENGNSAIKLAVQGNFEDVAELLFRNGATINQTLHVSCKQGNENLVKLLLAKGADIFELDENGGTPLHVACGGNPKLRTYPPNHSNMETDIKYVSSYFTCVKNLLTNVKKNIERTYIEELYIRNERIKVERTFSSLHLACFYSNGSLVSLELENGAEVNETCALGSTPLFVASLKGKYDAVKILLEKGANVNQTCIDGLTPLHAACLSNKNSNVKLLLESSAVVNCENNFGLVPLHIAVKTGNMHIVETLLEYGANINKHSRKGHTALSIACCENRLNIAKLLLENNAKVNATITNNLTPLDLSSSKGNFEITELLLQHNANINSGSTCSFTPLFYAFRHGNTAVVDLLLKWKASVNKNVRSIWTPLHFFCKNDSNLQALSLSFILFWTFGLQFFHAKDHEILEVWLPSAFVTYSIYKLIQGSICRPSYFLQHACLEGNQSMVEVLLKHTSNINYGSVDGKPLLHETYQNKHKQVANLLLNHGAEIHQEDENGQTLLHLTCEAGDRKNAEMLLKNGASINKTDFDGQTPLYIAAQSAKTDMIEFLLKHNCSVNICRLNGRSPLHASCATNKTKSVDLLLQYKSKINATDNFKNSPLHISCMYGHLKEARLLIQNNAQLNNQNSDERTPLHIACSGGYIDIVRILLEYEADINIKDSKNESVIYYACKNGFTNIFDLLSNYRPTLSHNDTIMCLQMCINKKYVDIAEKILARHTVNNISINELFYGACESGNSEIVELLIKFNASINAKDIDKKTPLFKASENDHIQTVKLLLAHGANIDDKCANGMTPLFITCMNGHKTVGKYLIEQQADVHLRDNDNITPYDVAFYLGYTDLCDILESQMEKLATPKDLSVYEKYIKLIKSRELSRSQQTDEINETDLPLNNARIVDIFLSFSGLINLKDNYGQTPLHRACNEGRSDIVELLLKNKATLSKDKYGHTGLHLACSKGHEKVVFTLLQKFAAKVNEKDGNGNTPLHRTCLKDYAKVAEVLIKANANVDLFNYNGHTPIFCAIIGNHKKVFEVLLKHGASVNKLNRWGIFRISPLAVAGYFCRFDMMYTMVDYNAETLGNNFYSFMNFTRISFLPIFIATKYNKIVNI